MKPLHLTLLVIPLILTASLLVGCGPKPTLRYPNTQLDELAQAWHDAFNRKEIDQMRLLIHPDRRGLFEQFEPDVQKQLARFTIMEHEVSERVEMDGGRVGQAIIFYMKDAEQPEAKRLVDNQAVAIEADGRWWLWRY